MRRHPKIFLLAVALAAVSISGCAPIREDRPQIMIYMQLRVSKTSADGPAVKIVRIQKANDPASSYTPSPDATLLWLRKGDYEAQLICLRGAGDNLDALSEATPAAADGYFHFTMQPQIDPRWKVEYSYYKLDCAVGTNGRPAFVIHPVMEITSE